MCNILKRLNANASQRQLKYGRALKRIQQPATPIMTQGTVNQRMM